MSSESLTAFAYHGGALDVARQLVPNPAGPWIDLSTGINPHTYPLPDLGADLWTRLPTRDALVELEAAAAWRYGGTAGHVVAGPGSQALIQALARTLRRRGVGVLGMTYGGHAEAFAAAGVRVVEVKRIEDLADFKVAIVVNPNNPDGRIERRDGLLDLHERLDRRGGVLIVDEAYADFDGAKESFAPVLPAYGAVVLRSFGKSFGLPGLRLGFAIASREEAERLRAALGPWPVSGPAVAIGTKALNDLDWTDAMAGRLAEDKNRLDALFVDAGWRVLGGTRLFRLAARDDAGEVFERLLEAGILTRRFPDAPDRLRFGIPGKESQWERLAAALAS